MDMAQWPHTSSSDLYQPINYATTTQAPTWLPHASSVTVSFLPLLALLATNTTTNMLSNQGIATYPFLDHPADSSFTEDSFHGSLNPLSMDWPDFKRAPAPAYDCSTGRWGLDIIKNDFFQGFFKEGEPSRPDSRVLFIHTLQSNRFSQHCLSGLVWECISVSASTTCRSLISPSQFLRKSRSNISSPLQHFH